MNDQIKYSGRCEHGNMPHECLQCQYEADEKRVKGTGHEAWEVWNRHVCIDKELTTGIETCTKLRNPSTVHKSLLHTYQRRPDADEMIKEWERVQDRKVETTESVLLNLVNAHIFRVNQLAEQADDVASCIPDWIDKLTKSLRSEFVNKGANSCRLCVKYRPTNCVGCPIFEDIENPSCMDTPEEKKGLINAYSAIEMIEYLIRLERKLRTHPLINPAKFCAQQSNKSHMERFTNGHS